MAVDLSALLSPCNSTRNQAEQALDALQETAPGQLAMHLIDSLANPSVEGVIRELCAVLLRRRLPIILDMRNERSGMPALTMEWREAVKSKLLQAVATECDIKLRRKICDAVGRVGIEFVSDGSWPHLMEFIHTSCTSGEPTAQEVALTILSRMAPALVEQGGWSTMGKPLQPMLVLALSASVSTVRNAALAVLAALLSACAEQEHDADDTTERKRLKAIASDLQGALPLMLSCLESAVSSADATQITSVLETLSQVAATQPRLFKSVLPSVVDGMAQLAGSSMLQLEARISCAEILLTIAEGAPKMVSKLEHFTPRTLGMLLPMLVRLGGDLDDWGQAEPDDGLLETDIDDDEEKEAAYAAEAIDRLCDVMGGKGVTELLIPMLQPMLAPSAPWTGRHAALIAIATVCEAGSSVLEPHLNGILDFVTSASNAEESRLRWASFYCAGLLCDEFCQIGESMHHILVPLVTKGMSDPCPRVRAAASLASVNLVSSMQQEQVMAASQSILSAAHTIMSAASSPSYVIYAATAALAVVCDTLADAIGKPMASAYSAFMPLLANRLPVAINARYSKLAVEILHAMGKLAAAAGAEKVGSDADSLIPSVVGLLSRAEVVEDRDLLRGVHTTLTSLASATGSAFTTYVETILPPLLTSATVEVDFHMEKVEVEEPDADEDDGWEVTYHQNKGKGFLKLRINAAQMDEKLLALDALYSYANALGSSFHPAVRAVVEASLPLLTYKWSDKVRAGAACLLGEAYKCTVFAAADDANCIPMAHATELAGVILKPISDQLNKDSSMVATDAMLDCFREVLVLERTHSVGVLQGASLNAMLQLVKRQLQLDDARIKARAMAAAERDDDEDTDDDIDNAEDEAELLATCAAMTIEVLKQHGDMSLPQVEAQLLPHVQAWLVASEVSDEGALIRLALGIDIVGAIIEHTSRDASKKYVAAVLPLLNQNIGNSDSRLRCAAYRTLGLVAEHGGKLLSRNATGELANRLVQALTETSARYSTNVIASEAAAAALGRVIVYRAAAVDVTAAMPVWLAWLPLRHSSEDAPIAMICLCKLLEADAASVFGPGGSSFPSVLGAMAAAFESAELEAGVSDRMKAIVRSWSAGRAPLNYEATALILGPHNRRMLLT